MPAKKKVTRRRPRVKKEVPVQEAVVEISESPDGRNLADKLEALSVAAGVQPGFVLDLDDPGVRKVKDTLGKLVEDTLGVPTRMRCISCGRTRAKSDFAMISSDRFNARCRRCVGE